jgi:hypothetical protein
MQASTILNSLNRLPRLIRRIGPAGITGIAALLVFSLKQSLFAAPDFDVHPRNIEHLLGDDEVRDTMRVDNAGDEDLVWSLDVIAAIEGWISADTEEGVTEPGGRDWIIVIQDGSDLEDGDYYASLRFRSNDPTREEFIVPVVGHMDAYPAITWWVGGDVQEWWGMDMNRLIAPIYWGNSYRISIWVGNSGGAQLEVEDLTCSNGYFELSPTQFNLDAGAWQEVVVTFNADEVGTHTTTITSISNAWDPRELNFRITASVEPVFRLGSPIPDWRLTEDAPETLVADLDTVFLSSDRGRRIQAVGAGLRYRIDNSGEFHIRPTLNWNGATTVVLTATLEDSVLSDTFQVDVSPQPDPPAAFDLIYPANGDTIHFGAVDSLNLFIWQRSSDPDGDTVSYRLILRPFGSDDSLVVSAISDTSYTRDIVGQIVNANQGGLFTWIVDATDGAYLTRAGFTFTNYVPPAGAKHSDTVALPDGYALVYIYPNPFNATTGIHVEILRPTPLKVVIVDLFGRTVSKLVDIPSSPAGSRYEWQPGNLISGKYWLSVQTSAGIAIYPLVVTK